MPSRYIGERSFYRRVFATALPIIAQNALTNFVSLLDNLMVGQLSTAQISGVTIVNNNLLFIFMLCMFGGAAGAGIFTTQFFGSQDHDGIRHTFRIKLLVCLVLLLGGGALFLTCGDDLIGLYLRGEGDPELARQTLFYGRQYLSIMLIGLLPFALTNAYAGTLRECGQPMVPMVAGLVATLVNLGLNFVLIFGMFGLPALGSAGAAIATVVARYVELAIVALWTHTHTRQLPFVKGLYRSFHIPGRLFRKVMLRGMPLLVNECLWSVGMAFLNQCYSHCGLDVVPALSISITIYDLACVVFRSLGNTVGIITGQMLGASTPEGEIRDANRRMSVLCVVSGALFGVAMGGLSFVFPGLYNTTDSVRHLASWLILISAAYMPLQAYIFPVYFTLRAGGKTVATFLFDCGAVWALSIPLAFCLSRFTVMHILVIYAICNGVDILKCVIGWYMIRKGDWIQNLAK